MLISIPFLGAACELYTQDDYQQQFLIESFMVASEPLPAVRVSTTAPFGAVYEFQNQSVSDAAVQINLLNDDGNVAEVYFYTEDSPGIYLANEAEITVKPRGRYELRVSIPDAEALVTARTIVPDTFSVVRASADTVVYQSPERLEVDLSRSFYPGRQNIFIASVKTLDPDAYSLTPFYADLDIDREDVLINESNIFNEANFPANPDNTVTLPLPWIAIAFYGPNEVTISAIDDNMYDFWRTVAVQRGQSNLSPGEIPNVRYNVDGGIGLFAGLARATRTVYIAER